MKFHIGMHIMGTIKTVRDRDFREINLRIIHAGDRVGAY